MTTGEQYFLIVVEEKSISRAAERLLLSPQNLSNYIGRLEKKYGVLFQRKPRFELTPRGQALFSTLQRVRVLERSLEKELADIQEEEYAHLRVGIHPARARSYLPFILGLYHKEFPQVKIDFTYKSAADCEQQLLEGNLDLLLSSDETPLPGLEYIRLCNEPIFFIISQRLLSEGHLEPAPGGVLRMSNLESVPLLLSPADSHFGRKISAFLAGQNVSGRRLYTISDFELQLSLAAQGIGACFCPQMSLHKVHELNRTAPEGTALRVFPIESFCTDYAVSLAVNKACYRSRALKGLIRVFEEGIPEYYKQYAFLPDE